MWHSLTQIRLSNNAYKMLCENKYLGPIQTNLMEEL